MIWVCFILSSEINIYNTEFFMKINPVLCFESQTSHIIYLHKIHEKEIATGRQKISALE